jgi:lipoprotein-anchoring transpeptidase ErfK/SrfK
MARYLSTLRSKRKIQIRNRIYIICGVVVAGLLAVIIFGRHPFGTSDQDPGLGNDPTENTTVTEDPIDKLPIEPNLGPKPRPTAEDEKKPVVDDTSPKVTVKVDDRVAKLLAEAIGCINATPPRILEARARLNEALVLPLTQKQSDFAKQQLKLLADTWLFSRVVLPGDKYCTSYRIQSGDNLEAIGRQFNVPYEILQQINNISDPRAIQVGQVIKVIKGPFNAVVYRSKFVLDLYLQQMYVRSFSVGLGKPGMETPTGLWRAELGGKLIKPIWTDPVTKRTHRPEEPDYPLGSRWIGLEGIEGGAVGRTGFAIHGTKDPEQIGTAQSQGCIRMYNGEVVLMYKLIMPGSSLVKVVP